MTAPDPFALGGRQDDAELIELERRMHELRRQSQALYETGEDDQKCDRLGEMAGEIEEQILKIPATTLVGCITKLRRLADPDTSILAGEGGNDQAALENILAVVEREAGRAAP